MGENFWELNWLQWERRRKAYPRSSEEPDDYCRPCRVGPHVGRSDGPVRPTRRPSYGPGRPSISSSFQPQPASLLRVFFCPLFFFFLIQLPLIVLMFSILFFFGPGPLVLLVERIDSYTVVVVLYRINRHVFRNKRRREILGLWGSLTPPMMYILIPNMKIYITENPNSRCGIDPMFLYRKS